MGKALAAKSDDLILIPHTHMVRKKELTPESCPLSSTQYYCHDIEHTHTHNFLKLFAFILQITQTTCPN